MEDMQMRLSALESVQNAAEELIKQASDTQDDAVRGERDLAVPDDTIQLTAGLNNTVLYYITYHYTLGCCITFK